MMLAAELLALADRCCREAPSAALDDAIGITIGARAPYTSSLDAALTLVPDDDADRPFFWRLGHDGEGPDPAAFKAELLQCSTLRPMTTVTAVADTPATAFCAAALRGRAGEIE